ncbi:hypothetical protein AWZ03_012563 [Drosophila navojoa]|uniref:Uncharacterized protein n=1 Tax=Drosophila navojoa TaxID=7232 RepID=A0A484AX88_DRONA|nr:hypothetical protein AWZ03_012563 [Drosophila navojoa]
MGDECYMDAVTAITSYENAVAVAQCPMPMLIFGAALCSTRLIGFSFGFGFSFSFSFSFEPSSGSNNLYTELGLGQQIELIDRSRKQYEKQR